MIKKKQNLKTLKKSIWSSSYLLPLWCCYFYCTCIVWVQDYYLSLFSICLPRNPSIIGKLPLRSLSSKLSGFLRTLQGCVCLRAFQMIWKRIVYFEGNVYICYIRGGVWLQACLLLAVSLHPLLISQSFAAMFPHRQQEIHYCNLPLHCSEHKHNGQAGKNTLGLNSATNRDAG